jgi:hypothetical protein
MRRIASLITIASTVALLAVALTIVPRRSAPPAPAAGASLVTSPAPPGRPVLRLVQYAQSGSGQVCDGDSCGSGVPIPLTFTVPANAGPARATITTSVQYRASGRARFIIHPEFKKLAGARVALLPPSRPLLPTGGRWQSATVEFESVPLAPGATYRLWIYASLTDRDSNQARIGTAKVLTTVELGS